MPFITQNIQLWTNSSRNFELLSHYCQLELLGENVTVVFWVLKVECWDKKLFWYAKLKLLINLIFGDIILIFRVISRNFALNCIETEK